MPRRTCAQCSARSSSPMAAADRASTADRRAVISPTRSGGGVKPCSGAPTRRRRPTRGGEVSVGDVLVMRQFQAARGSARCLRACNDAAMPTAFSARSGRWQRTLSGRARVGRRFASAGGSTRPVGNSHDQGSAGTSSTTQCMNVPR